MALEKNIQSEFEISNSKGFINLVRATIQPGYTFADFSQSTGDKVDGETWATALVIEAFKDVMIGAIAYSNLIQPYLG